MFMFFFFISEHNIQIDTEKHPQAETVYKLTDGAQYLIYLVYVSES